MKQVLSASILMFLLFLNGCKDSTTESNGAIVSTGNIIPLAVGNKWNWNITQYSETGSETYLNDSIYVKSVLIKNDTNWYVLRINNTDQTVTNLSDGIYSKVSESLYILYKYPVVANDSFSVNNGTNYTRVTSINSIITVPSGTYSCYKYEYVLSTPDGSGPYTKTVNYISPNYGFVKIEYYKWSEVNKSYTLIAKNELNKITLK